MKEGCHLLASQLVTAAKRRQPRSEHPRFGGPERHADSGGNTWNVLPESVELEGTLRTHSSEVQQRVKARVSEIAAGLPAPSARRSMSSGTPGHRAGQ